MKADWASVSHRAFKLGILIKGIDGLLELVGGSALLLTSRPAIRHAVALLTRHELIEDPGDLVAGHLMHLAQQLSLGTRYFAGIYLLAHGAVKVGMVIALLRNKRWAYPLAVAILAAFIGYQVYRIVGHPSQGLALLTAIDVAVLALIVREWRHRSAPVTAPN